MAKGKIIALVAGLKTTMLVNQYLSCDESGQECEYTPFYLGCSALSGFFAYAAISGAYRLVDNAHLETLGHDHAG